MGSYPTVVDWNNDTYHDLLVGGSNGTVTIYLNTNNNTNPILDNGALIQAGGGDLDVGIRATPVVDDWDGDGKKDLIVGDWDGNIEIYINTGTDAVPVFTSPTLLQVGGVDFDISPSTAGGRAAPRIIDWDGDGFNDLLVGDVFGNVTYLKNVGTNDAPVFNSAEELLLADGSLLKFDEGGNAGPRSRLFPTDWNEDGLTDLIVGGENGTLELYIAAPEPVSSTLFLIGGGLLGFRGIRRKINKV